MSPPSKKQQPTNSDLMKEIREVKSMQTSQGDRISTLELWKVSEDAYRAALARVKDEEEDNKFRKLRDGELSKRSEVLKQVGIILGLITAILYAYLSTKGIRAG